jgi:hypothetical protein
MMIDQNVTKNHRSNRETKNVTKKHVWSVFVIYKSIRTRDGYATRQNYYPAMYVKSMAILHKSLTRYLLPFFWQIIDAIHCRSTAQLLHQFKRSVVDIPLQTRFPHFTTSTRLLLLLLQPLEQQNTGVVGLVRRSRALVDVAIYPKLVRKSKIDFTCGVLR